MVWNRLTVRRVLEAMAAYPDREALRREYPELEDEDLKRALEYAAGMLADKTLPLFLTSFLLRHRNPHCGNPLGCVAHGLRHLATKSGEKCGLVIGFGIILFSMILNSITPVNLESCCVRARTADRRQHTLFKNLRTDCPPWEKGGSVSTRSRRSGESVGLLLPSARIRGKQPRGSRSRHRRRS